MLSTYSMYSASVWTNAVFNAQSCIQLFKVMCFKFAALWTTLVQDIPKEQKKKKKSFIDRNKAILMLRNLLKTQFNI